MSQPTLVGRTLGVYRLLSLIGEGGMGQVYRARDERLGRDVAVKTISANAPFDPSWASRFEREARAIAALNHPNILAIYDVGETDGIAYFVTELVEGQSLREVLKAAPLSLAQAIDLAAQIAAGLAEAHLRGVVHRDIKPGNIIVTADRRAKILDFGLARILPPIGAAPDASALTQSVTTHGAVIGTAAYMAPEQARGDAVDARADTFSLGAVLFEMVAGRSAFARANMLDTLTAVLTETPPRLGSVGRDSRAGSIPPGLERLVARCLEKLPADRWQSMADLSAELRWIGETCASTGASAPIQAATGPRSGPRRLPLALTAGALVLAVAIGGYVGRSWPGEADANLAGERVHLMLPDGSTRGAGGRPTIARDGRIAFGATAAGETTSELFLKTAASIDAERLPNSKSGAWPAFSPDGLSLAFRAGRRLKILRLGDRDVQDVCEVPVSAGYFDWANADEIVFSFNDEPKSGVMSVRLPYDGNAPRPLAIAESGREHSLFAPQRIAGSTVLIYAARAADSLTTRVMVKAADAEDPRVLIDGATSARYLDDGWLLFQREGQLFAERFDPATRSLSGQPVLIAADLLPSLLAVSGSMSWSAGADSIVYRSDDRPARRLVWITRANEIVPAADSARSQPESVVISPTGDRAILRSRDHGTLSQFDFRSGIETRATSDVVLTAPVWMPDGGSILVIKAEGGQFGIHRQSLGDTSRSEAILSDAIRNKHFGSVTRDGSQVVFSQDNGASGADIMIAPVRAGARSSVLVGSPADERRPMLSADNAWLSYLADRALWVAPFPAGRPAVAVAQNAVEQRWSSKGAELFFRQDGQLRSVVMRRSGPPSLPTTLFTRRFIPTADNYDVSPDGRFLMLDELPVARSPFFVVIQNWRRLASGSR